MGLSNVLIKKNHTFFCLKTTYYYLRYFFSNRENILTSMMPQISSQFKKK